MIKISKYAILSVLLFTVFFTGFAFAQDKDFVDGKSLVPCGNDRDPKSVDSTGKELPGSRKISNPCNFTYIFVMINNILNFILVYLAVPIAAIMFAYAGYLLLFSGGNEGDMKKAKGIFTDVAWGLVIIAIAWLAIKLVLSTLDYTGFNPFT